MVFRIVLREAESGSQKDTANRREGGTHPVAHDNLSSTDSKLLQRTYVPERNRCVFLRILFPSWFNIPSLAKCSHILRQFVKGSLIVNVHTTITSNTAKRDIPTRAGAFRWASCKLRNNFPIRIGEFPHCRFWIPECPSR